MGSQDDRNSDRRVTLFNQVAGQPQVFRLAVPRNHLDLLNQIADL